MLYFVSLLKINIRKLLLLTITILANVSFASFPVADTLRVKQDPIKTESVDAYHVRMKRMVFVWHKEL